MSFHRIVQIAVRMRTCIPLLPRSASKYRRGISTKVQNKRTAVLQLSLLEGRNLISAKLFQLLSGLLTSLRG